MKGMIDNITQDVHETEILPATFVSSEMRQSFSKTHVHLPIPLREHVLKLTRGYLTCKTKAESTWKSTLKLYMPSETLPNSGASATFEPTRESC